jgi:hypothetical protein
LTRRSDAIHRRQSPSLLSAASIGVQGIRLRPRSDYVRDGQRLAAPYPLSAATSIEMPNKLQIATPSIGLMKVTAVGMPITTASAR